MNIILLALGFVVLLVVVGAVLNRKPGKKRGKRRHRRCGADRGGNAKSIPQEMKPYIKRLNEAKTRDERLSAIMDLQGRFGKEYPELAKMWMKRGERIVEREKGE